MTQNIVNNGPTLPVVDCSDGSVGWVSTDTVTPPTAASLAGLPPDYREAPDIADKPWQRRRGDEWTDAPTRAAVMGRIAELIRLNPTILSWAVKELACGDHSFARDPRLVVEITQSRRCGAVLATRQVGFVVAPADRNPEGVLRLLALAEPSLYQPA